MGKNVCQYFGRHVFFILNASYTSVCKLRWYIVTDLSFLRVLNNLIKCRCMRVNLFVLKLFENLCVLWTVIILCTSNISNSKPVHWCISCKPVTALISSKPVKSFVTCKPVCFSNVSIAINFTSGNYCSVTCAEHPVNVISSTVRKSVLSYRTACPIDFGIVVQTANVTLLCTYRYVSFKINHHITPTLISILELPLHSARLAQFSHQHYQIYHHLHYQKHHSHQHPRFNCYYRNYHLHHHHDQFCSYHHHHWHNCHH